MQTQEAAHVTEVMRQKGDAGVIRQIAAGIAVLVKGEELPLWPQSFEYSPGVAATAKGQIGIDSVGPDGESIERLFQENRQMIGILLLAVLVARLRHEPSPPGFITCFARLLNASGEKDSKNCWYLLLSQISILSTAAASTTSFSRPACSFRFWGINNRPAESSSTIVAPFRKYLLN